MGYPFLTFVRSVFVELGGEALGAADNEGADETAVHNALCLTENYIKGGVLLVKDIDIANRLLLRDQGLYGLFVAIQRNAED